MTRSPLRGITLSNWMEPPHNRLAFQHVRELTPTAAICAGDRPLDLPRRPIDLDRVTFERADGSTVDWAAHLATTWCDAVCVMHRGAIVDERYFNGMDERTLHLLMSVSKSVCGAALGVSVGRGRLGMGDLVCDLAPEFAGTSLDGASVRHLIDMTAGTDFVEDYDDYASVDEGGTRTEVPLIEYERHAGYRPLGDRQPVGTLGHFRTYGIERPHGEWFSYRSPLTNIVARVLEAVEGIRYPDIVSRDLWGPLGMERDADIMLDPLGHPVVEGGMSCTLRDLLRLGLAYSRGGLVGDVQAIPASWVSDTFYGDDDCVRAFRAGSPDGEVAPDWSMYRNAFWVLRRHDRISGLGIFGQFCWVDLATDTVIARFSTFPSALPLDTSDEVHRSFIAVAEALASE